MTRAEEVRSLITQSGKSQREIAEELGVTSRSVRYWVSGERHVPLIAVYALRYLVGKQ